MGQLTFPGLEHPLSPSQQTDYILRAHWLEPMREFMQARSPLLFGDWNGYMAPRHEQLTLFEPAPRCPKYYELDEGYMDCHLDAGHGGEHFDAMARIWWREG